VKRDGLKKCTDIVRKKHLISEVESVSVILSDLCVLISEGIVFHLTFKLSLRATMWLVWLNFLMASFLSFSHPFAMASSLTILKLTEVMALPHITFRPEDC